MKSSIYKQRGPLFKIIVGGSFTSYDGTTQSRITRLNSNGTRDMSFTVGTGFDGPVNAFAVQSNGKIFAGGSFTSYNGTTANRITKLNSDGTLDDIFSGGSRANNEVKAVAIQSVDNIIIGGAFTSYNGYAQNRITRLKSNDGTLSSTLLSIGTGFDAEVSAIAIQSDLKILAGGQFTSYNGTTQNYITRLNSNGTRDTSFVIGTGFDGPVSTIAIQSDGKILVGGYFTAYNGTTQNCMTRLNSDGTLDTGFTFTFGNTDFLGEVYAVAVQSNGKILIGGDLLIFDEFGNLRHIRIARLNFDGSRDTSFRAGGFNDPVYTIAIQSDGKIVVGGVFSIYDDYVTYDYTDLSCIARLNSDGTLDTGFTAGFDFSVYAIAIAIS
jgi:uncharacterized delta-60 repeat protein